MIFEQIIRGFQFLVIIFLVLSILMNMNPRLPRFPWDVFIDKFGFSLYLPITTSLAAALLLAATLNALSFKF